MEALTVSSKFVLWARFSSGPCRVASKCVQKFHLLSTNYSAISPYESVQPTLNLSRSVRFFSSTSESTASSIDEEFQPLDIVKSKSARRFGPRKQREKKEVAPPRFLKMPTNQDWPSVWPTAKTFHPASVPLPLHQGYVPLGKTVPNKYANLELMKIPNFLHLTPPAIRRHCEALKQFCSKWPEELKDDYVLENLFPIEVVTNDYCHSSPSIRDPKSRIVTLRVKLSMLNLDDHAKDKFLRLVGERYNPSTDELTFVTDCCPLRKQNYDYAMYLLTAVYHEAKNKESWEEEKTEADMEKFVWEGSSSEKTLQAILSPDFMKDNAQLVEDYKTALLKLLNQGENSEVLSEYGKSVRKLLNLPEADDIHLRLENSTTSSPSSPAASSGDS